MKYIVNGDLNLFSNYFLESLRGLPEEIGGDLDIRNCISLNSLDHGLGKKIRVGGMFRCNSKFTEKDVKKYFEVRDIVFNEVDLGELLINASRNGRKEVVEVLLEKGADINLKDNTGWTALMFASLNGHKEVVELLLEKGANVNLKNNYGMTALMLASRNGHKEVVELLLEKGADVNLKNNQGMTVLMIASSGGNKEIVELLKKHGAK